ncbi:MAG: zinc-dependent metalloprotease [Saprospiraceae bacterium]|nr:zinc-dependent metalloprotease [Saprospiraceae bacterium]
MKKVIYLFLFLLPSLVEAQTRGLDRLLLPTTPRRYHTQKNYQRLLTIDRDMARRRAFLDMQLNLNPASLTQDVTIPVVVHLLYKAGSDTRNLPSASDIRQQLDIVSKDFRQTIRIQKHKADTEERFAEKNALDTRISFCLASKDLSGANTTGVLTVPTSITTWLADDKMKSAQTGGSTAWDIEKYLNIWVVNFPDSISGYAQMPAGPASTDGIVIDYRYFGKKPNNDKTFPYTEGKTLTHLVGSYLNLYELWSETTLCADDGVDDTPIANAPTLGNVDYRFVSTCNGNPVIMSMNFMDNTNDNMLYMFTNGQKRRMHACLAENGIRYKLVQSGAAQCSNGNPNAQIVQQNPPKPPTTTPQSPISYRIYPNPAQVNINLDLGVEKGGEATLTIYNAQGGIQASRTYKVTEGSQSFSIDCSSWVTGLYIAHLKVNDEVLTERILIQR